MKYNVVYRNTSFIQTLLEKQFHLNMKSIFLIWNVKYLVSRYIIIPKKIYNIEEYCAFTIVKKRIKTGKVTFNYNNFLSIFIFSYINRHTGCNLKCGTAFLEVRIRVSQNTTEIILSTSYNLIFKLH